jgi:Chalcone isomerase-like
MRISIVGIFSLASVLLVSAGAPLGMAALAGELAGITMPDTLKVGEKTLKLNGLGLRKKSVFKVYVGGLYLEAPSKDAGAIVASNQTKAIRMHFLRDLTKAQLVEGFQEGFEGNVKEGTTMTFAYLPGKGTTLLAGTKELGVFEGKGFADVVFSIWLGPKPPSEELKTGMLG